MQAVAPKIADLIERGYKVVLTHGNGPQVGATLLRHEAAKNVVPPFPLDACGAETQGLIGYMIQQALRNELKLRRIEKHVVTVVTRVTVDSSDQAFEHPTKPVGPFYTKQEADELSRRLPGLTVKEDSGRGYRRVVPSPDPKIIVEGPAIRALVNAEFVVVSTGGGGIPIVEESGYAHGVEAVIDKDLAGQRLATLIGADVFVILTDVEGACLNFGTPEQKVIGEVTSDNLQGYLSKGHFRDGSMAPKVKAALRFVEHGGERAIIAELSKLVEALEGRTGTQILRSRD